MKVSSGLWALVVLAICGLCQGQRIDDICEMFADKTVIRDPESCSRSITCLDGKSTYSTCTGSKPFFDKTKLTCVSSLEDSEGCEVSCVNATLEFVADPKSCFGYYYCADEETPLYGTCPDNMHFNSTTQECIWNHASECHSKNFDYCSIIKDGVKFDNVLGCDRYYVCTKGKLVDSTCPTGYYQKRTGICEPKTSVYCEAHPLPKNVCGTAKAPKKNVLVADGATCHGYFFCTEQRDGSPDPNPRWGRCLDNLFFDKSTQLCTEPNKVVCSEDRCQGRTIPFVLSPKKGCRHYLRCANGRTLDEKSCGNYFFDEANEMCVGTVLKYAIC